MTDNTELYTCGICGWYKTDDVGELYEHRGSWHVDY